MVSTNPLEALAVELSTIRHENEMLQESVNSLATRATDAFWTPLDQLQALGGDTGINLDKLKDLSVMLRDRVAASSLHGRAVQLTHAYVFGQGVSIDVDKLQPRIKDAIEHPYNQNALFGQNAQKELTAAMYTDGQVFMLRDTRTRVLTRVPLDQIGGLSVDEDSAERVWHVKRTWTVNGQQREAWYPTALYYNATPKGQRVSTIEDGGRRYTVDETKVVHMTSVGRQVGWALGLPVGLPAVQWIETYSKFIQNSASLVESYSKIAFTFTQKASQVNAAAVTVMNTQAQQVGGVAGMGLQDSLTAMPAMGSQVSFSNGRPIASLAASAIGISVVALLSDPGAAGSSYGAAQTLDVPTVLVMGVWQDLWKAFISEILLDVGANKDNLYVEFPAIENDVPYRQLASLAQAFVTGAIHREEYRSAVLDILDIPDQKQVDDLPEADQFNGAHAIAPEYEDEEPDAEGTSTSADPLPRQGNTGAVGKQQFDKNANRQADKGKE